MLLFVYFFVVCTILLWPNSFLSSPDKKVALSYKNKSNSGQFFFTLYTAFFFVVTCQKILLMNKRVFVFASISFIQELIFYLLFFLLLHFVSFWPCAQSFLDPAASSCHSTKKYLKQRTNKYLCLTKIYPSVETWLTKSDVSSGIHNFRISRNDFYETQSSIFCQI